MGQPQQAALYARISQDRTGAMVGVQRQETLCRDLAEAKGWQVGEVYVDDDRSAYSGKPRPAYQRMLADLEAGVRDGVIVVDTDRLTRRPAELEEFIDLAEKRGIPVANAAGDLDLATSDGRFRARIMGVVARQESEKKSERVKRQREQLAQEGKPAPTERAFGYEHGFAAFREPEATMVREAAPQVLAGRTFRSVADEWNAAGVYTVRGKTWTVTAVHRVLTRPLNAGLRVHHGEVLGEGTWEPILDRDTHERLVAMCEQRRRPGRPPRTLLGGLAVCGACGEVLVSSSANRAAIYACRRVAGQRDNACGSLSVRTHLAEAEVRDQLLGVVDSDAFADALASTDTGDDGEAESLRSDEERLDQLATDYADAAITRREWLAARDRLQRRIAATRARMEASSTTAALRGLPSGQEALRQWWEEADTDARRAVIEAACERVEIAPADRSKPRSRFDPDRVRITWRV